MTAPTATPRLVTDELDLLAELVPLHAAVRARFEPHMTADGAHFTRPMHVRLLRKRGR